MSDPELIGVWHFTKMTGDRFDWDLRAIQKFALAARQLSRSLLLDSRIDVDPSLCGKAAVYPRAFLDDLATEVARPRRRREIERLFAALGTGLLPGACRTLHPSFICKRAVELGIGGLVLPSESATSQSLRSRVGKALASADQRTIAGLHVEVVGRNRQRKYLITREDADRANPALFWS